MLILRPGETPTQIEIKRYDRSPTLDEMRTAIGGGYIELVPWFKTIGVAVGPDAMSATIMDCVAFCDEEGKLKHLPVNENATSAWEQAVRRITGKSGLDDRLCGTVIILYGDKAFMESL
jgi:hypothetical protein